MLRLAKCSEAKAGAEAGRRTFDAHRNLAFVTNELTEHCYPDVPIAGGATWARYERASLMAIMRMSPLSGRPSGPISRASEWKRENMRAPLWLKMLRRWPELRVAVEENADRPRSQQERNALEIRKAEAAAWSYRSLYGKVSTDSAYWRARAAQAIAAAQQSDIPLVQEVMTKVAAACASLAAPDPATVDVGCILAERADNVIISRYVEPGTKFWNGHSMAGTPGCYGRIEGLGVSLSVPE